MKTQSHKTTKPGDIFVCRETADFAVQWLIVEELTSSEVLVVPIDAHPTIGPRDIALEDVDYESELVARCGYAIETSRGHFHTHLRTGAIGKESLNRVRSTIRRLTTGEASSLGTGDRALEEIETSPEYEDWIADTIAPALDRLGGTGTSASSTDVRVKRELDFAERAKQRTRPPSTTNRTSYPTLRTAAILAIGVGLGLLASLWLLPDRGGKHRVESAIETNIPVFLLAEAETERAGSSKPRLPFPEGHESMTVALSAIDSHLHDAYRIEVYTPAEPSREPLVIDGLVPDAQGLLTLRLSDRERWRRGARFQLFALSPDASAPLASYRLEFE